MGSQMDFEREDTPAVLASKIEQILETVHEIKNKLSQNEDKLITMQRDMDHYSHDYNVLKERMDKQEKKQEDTKKYIYGILGTIITTAAIGIINLFLKIPI